MRLAPWWSRHSSHVLCVHVHVHLYICTYIHVVIALTRFSNVNKVFSPKPTLVVYYLQENMLEIHTCLLGSTDLDDKRGVQILLGKNPQLLCIATSLAQFLFCVCVC